MSLATIMREQLAGPRRVIEDGHEMVPAWRIATGEGNFLIFTRFDTDKDAQRERTLFLISRFMAWKMATSFVLTAEMWLGAEKTRSGDEALLAMGFRATSASRCCSAFGVAMRSASANPCGSRRITSTISISPCCPRVLRNYAKG